MNVKFSYIFLLCVCSQLFSQKISYSIKNGLPSNNVYSIKQDKKGFIWATTDKGVVRYDGRNFKLFTIDNGLASNDNFVMLIDSKDNIWLYSFKAISRIEPDGRCKIFGETRSYFSHFVINSKDELFYSTFDFKSDEKLKHFIIKNSNTIEIKLPYDKYVGFGSLGFYFNDFYHTIGFNKLNQSKPIFLKFDGREVKESNELKSYNLIPNILNDSKITLDFIKIKENYVVFSSNYYSKFVEDKNTKVNRYPFNLSKIISGNIYSFEKKLYLFFNKGIYSYNIENDEWHPYLELPKATSIILDQEKNVWVSTLGDGLVKYVNLDIKTGKENIVKISSDVVKKVSGYKSQSLWKANSRNEILELKNRRKKYTPDLIDLRFLATDQFGDVYFGGSNAVYKNGKVFSNFGFKAMDIDHDSIALTTTFGVNFLKKNELKSFRGYDNRQLTDIKGRMYAILLLEGKFYSGNQQGLFWGKPNIDALHPICLDGENTSISVIGIKRTNDGLIWVATEGNGVYLLKDDEVIRHFNSELLDANIHSIKTDEKDRIWLATRKGVNMIHKVGSDFNVTKYTSFHGLPDDYVNDIYCYDDILYVATDEGLVKLNIKQLNETNFYLPPPVHINSIKVLGASWQIVRQDSIPIFEHNENTINFEYSGISYKSNGKVRFEYRLIPSVEDWLQTPNDNITFNNLEPDKYTFEVRAIDAIGNVSKVPAKLSFVIKKHFSQQLWFILLLWLLSAILVTVTTLQYFKYKRNKAAEKSKVEKLISELRLKSLQSQLNPHFIFNSLNAIQQFINTENKKSANDYLAKFARLMRLYLNGSDSQFITLKQEIEVLKLYCSLEHLRFADNFQYSIEVNDDLPLDEYKVPAMLLQPHVENAIRHGLIPSTKDNNFLYINVKESDKGILCEIIDNGIGREKSLEMKKKVNSEHRSMGNKISKERLDMIRALKLGYISEFITDLKDESGMAIGTKVEIFIAKS